MGKISFFFFKNRFIRFVSIVQFEIDQNLTSLREAKKSFTVGINRSSFLLHCAHISIDLNGTISTDEPNNLTSFLSQMKRERQNSKKKPVCLIIHIFQAVSESQTKYVYISVCGAVYATHQYHGTTYNVSVQNGDSYKARSVLAYIEFMIPVCVHCTVHAFEPCSMVLVYEAVLYAQAVERALCVLFVFAVRYYIFAARITHTE